MSKLFYKADKKQTEHFTLSNIQNITNIVYPKLTITNLIDELIPIIPPNVRFVQIEMVGGGGGGGGSSTYYQGNWGGGGAGAYIRFNIDMINVTSLTCSVGRGGESNMSGDPTIITINDNIIMTAGGGNPGISGTQKYDTPITIGAISTGMNTPSTTYGMIPGYGGVGGKYTISSNMDSSIITDEPLCVYGGSGENSTQDTPGVVGGVGGTGGCSYFGGGSTGIGLDKNINNNNNIYPCYGAGGGGGAYTMTGKAGNDGVIIVSYSII